MATYLGLTKLNETLVPFDVLVVTQVIVLIFSKSEPPPRSAVIRVAGRTEQGTEASLVKAQRCGVLRGATALAVLLHDVADAVIINQQTAARYRAVSGVQESDARSIMVADQRLRADESRKYDVDSQVSEHGDVLCDRVVCNELISRAYLL